jgi:ribosomal protein S15P/S13E
MINTIATILGTGVVVGGAIGTILTGFYKTNKSAQRDYKEIEEKFDKKIEDLRNSFENRVKDNHSSIKQELDKISSKIDNITTNYVSNENFKTYADTMNKLLEMTSERIGRVENTLEDIREDITIALNNKN